MLRCLSSPFCVDCPSWNKRPMEIPAALDTPRYRPLPTAFGTSHRVRLDNAPPRPEPSDLCEDHWDGKAHRLSVATASATFARQMDVPKPVSNCRAVTFPRARRRSEKASTGYANYIGRQSAQRRRRRGESGPHPRGSTSAPRESAKAASRER